MTTAVALIALFVICIGFAMLVANPSRFTNQIFAFGALLLSGELFMIYMSIIAGSQFQSDGTTRPLFWLRASGFLAPLFPWILWLLVESITSTKAHRNEILSRSNKFLVPSIFFSFLSLTEWYIPSTSSPSNIIYGSAYYIQSSALLLLYIYIAIRSLSSLSKQTGIRRIELHLLVSNLSITSISSVALLLLGNLYSIYPLKQAAIFILLFSFLLTACTLAAYRVFTVHQLLISGIQRILISAGFYLIIQSAIAASSPGSPLPLELSLLICISCLAVSWIDRNSIYWLGLDGRRRLERLRRNAIDIARTEPHREELVSQLQQLIRVEFETSRAIFLFSHDSNYISPELSIEISNQKLSALVAITWATPESLERRRPNPQIKELADLLDQNGLSLMIAIPRGSPRPSLLLALGSKGSKAPYTYPEVKQIQEIAELMDNLLIRSQLSSQLELQTRLENLAVMSRGLAHDLKNLITPVSTFINSHECRTNPKAGEDTVYLAARRSMRVINDYVEEAHFFSKQLVPRLEPVNPHELLQEVLLALQTKAARESVVLELGPTSEETIQADRVLLLRLISNLLDNAIDASKAGGRVSLQARKTPEGQIKFAVVDSGAGIPSEALPRIFEPYFTTKDLGTEVHGFGLGLAISQKIVEIHGGKIAVRTSVGAGTTFEVSLPCGGYIPQPSSSPQESPGAARSLALAAG